MQLGMIGLGRMGANLVRRLQRAGHQCVVHDRNQAAVGAAAGGHLPGRAGTDHDHVEVVRHGHRFLHSWPPRSIHARH